MVYDLAWRVYYGIWYGFAGTALYMVWPGGPRMVYSMAWWASHGIMVWPCVPCMGYGTVLRALHGIVWPSGHRMVEPGGHRMAYCYGLAGKAWYSIWYGLVDMAWYMVWPGGQGMVYDMAWWARHDI